MNKESVLGYSKKVKSEMEKMSETGFLIFLGVIILFVVIVAVIAVVAAVSYVILWQEKHLTFLCVIFMHVRRLRAELSVWSAVLRSEKQQEPFSD